MKKSCDAKWWHYVVVLVILFVLSQIGRLVYQDDTIVVTPTPQPTLVVVRYSSKPSPRWAGHGSVERPEPDVTPEPRVVLSVDEYQTLLEAADGS